jgi:hypothetical protein
MALQNEKIVRTVSAGSPGDLELKVSEAFTDLPGAMAILVSEDTLKSFIMGKKDLKNPASTFEKAKAGKQLFGRPMGIEKRAGNAFIVTDLENCIVVRYEPV